MKLDCLSRSHLPCKLSHRCIFRLHDRLTFHSLHCRQAFFPLVARAQRSNKGGSYDDLENNSSGGDPAVQEDLVDMLQLQIGKKQVEDYVDLESEKLRQGAEEAKRKIDRIAQEQEERSAESFDTAMEEINKTAAEFEEELRKDREAQKANVKEFAAWEHDMAVKRSEGLFFKGLYQTEDASLLSEDGRMLKEAAAAQAEETARKAQSGLLSGIRMTAFAAMSALQLLCIVADALSDNHRWVLDAINAWLAIGFARFAIKEFVSFKSKTAP